MNIERGIEDIKTLIPFMNKVFRKNFPRLLPKLYTTNEYHNNHYVVYEGKEIIGAIASIPNTLKIYDDSLKGYGVGMVSCHKKYRGKGVMSTMLRTIIEDAKREGADFMYLDGNRQRYEYYGFVPAGYKYTYTLTTPNFEHMREDIPYTFVPLTEDSPYLKKVIEIYNSYYTRYERKDFYKVLHSWNINKIYAILNASGDVVGHIAYKWLKIVDFATSEPQNTAYIVKAFAEKHTHFFGKIDLYPNETQAIASVARYAQSSELHESTQFKILHYRHVVEALLNMQSHVQVLPDVDINIVIEGAESFHISCKDNVVKVNDLQDGAQTYTFSESEATLKLFSPTLATTSGLPFSLPLFSMTCDNV